MDNLIQAVVANAKTGKWLACHIPIETPDGPINVGVKAFGRWVQRLEVAGICSGVPECRTNKALAEGIRTELRSILRAVGVRGV